MPLPDYSKFKADIKKPKKSDVRKGKISSLEADLAGLMDEESNRSRGNHRRKSSGMIGYDMGFDLPVTAIGGGLGSDRDDSGSSGGMNNDMSVSMLNGSAGSLGDPFYDEEESVTEHYEEEEEEGEEDDDEDYDESNLNNSRVSIQSSEIKRSRRPKNKKDPRMNKSASDASAGGTRSRKFPDNHARRSLRDSSPGSRAMGDGTLRSVDSASSKKSAKSLDNFLDKSNRRGRKKTSLLPGSRTEDLRSEMNEVVSLMSAKRSGARSIGGSVRSNSRDSGTGAGFRSRSSDPGAPPLRRSITDDGVTRSRGSGTSTGGKLRDYSVRSTGSGDRGATPSKRTPRRSKSEDEPGIPANPARTRALPTKSKSCDGSQRHLTTRGSGKDHHHSTLTHTHQSFVTGSRIRRITPGGDNSNNLHGSLTSFQASTSNLSRDGSFRGIQRERSRSRDISPSPQRQGSSKRSVSPSKKGKKHRSVSPSGKKHSSSKSGTKDGKEKATTKKKKERVKDSEVPPLVFS